VGCSTRLLENEIRVLRDESNRLQHEKVGLAERLKENHEKIKLNNQARRGHGGISTGAGERLVSGSSGRQGQRQQAEGACG